MRPFRLPINEESDIELATLSERSVAFIIDYALVYVVYLVVLLSSKELLPVAVMAYKLNIFPFLVYKIGMESVTGTTIGKRLMNITVIDASHQPPAFPTVVKRHLIYLLMAAIAFSYAMLFKLDAFSSFMSQHFPVKTINGIGITLSKYLINAFAFVDLVSISWDPDEQNRSLHDRVGGTLVVKVKPKAR